MNLIEIRNRFIAEGYDFLDASSKVCQDILLSKIAKSPLSKNVTIKGGVVIQGISTYARRATRDLDLDLIKYPLEDSAIHEFIRMLDRVDDGVLVKIVSPIEKLSHQEYHGKRVSVELTDSVKNTIGIKLDVGVHKSFKMEQEEFCFELSSIGECVQLLINSKEQMFTEKLKSLLKLGRFSTRYKDLFDFYYFINMTNLDKSKLINCLNEIIFDAEDMKEKNVEDIYNRLKSILANKTYAEKANTARNNWLGLPFDKVIDSILLFFSTLKPQ